MIISRPLIIMVFLMIFATPVYAQADADDGCPLLIEQALEQVGDVCAPLGRNEVCYGNELLVTTARAADDLSDFVTSGDITAVNRLLSLNTAPLDPELSVWGVAMMALQANIPDTLPGQNVIFVIYGDTKIDVDPDAATDFPMQAFRLSTGIGQSTCAEAPTAGLLVQAPQDTTVNFTVNGVEVAVGSTVFLHMVDGLLDVSTLAGTAEVTSQNVTETVTPGNWTQMDADTAPFAPQPYNYTVIQHLPVDVLPDPVNIPVTVPPVFEWLDSGIMVEAGERVNITASGSVNLWADCDDYADNTDCSLNIYEPAGRGAITQADVANYGYPFVGVGIGALMGRIGETGEPFFVGEGTTLTAATDGTLQFFINDDPPEDNSGAYIVMVTGAID